MRNPELLNSIEYNGDKLEVLSLKNIPVFDIEDYNLLDEKEFNKYILSIKSICRNSIEYKNMIKFLRENMSMNRCSFYQNVNNIDTFKIKIHIHHEPFTIEDIIRIVYNKRLYYGEDLEDEMVAKETMILHYNLMIGLIPLAETPHELVHNGYLFVPITKVLGNVEWFVNTYKDFIPNELLELYEKNKEYSAIYDEHLHKNVLSKHYVYLDCTGLYEMPNYEELKDILQQRLYDLKNNNTNKIQEAIIFVKEDD